MIYNGLLVRTLRSHSLREKLCNKHISRELSWLKKSVKIEPILKSFRAVSWHRLVQTRKILRGRIFKFGILGGSSFLAASALLENNTEASNISCQEAAIKVEETVIDPEFPWQDFFWEYIVPELLPLTLAIVSALLGAAMNMKIPIALGDLINILNQNMQAGVANVADYVSALRNPAKQLITLYIAQGVTTFAYIALLSQVGENIACRLRQNLFKSFLHQDVSFYDQHKTGEMIDRLTSDVQDFKSSFKLCVSQGVRCVAQTAGCVFALYATCAKLTLVLAVSIPLLVLGGALFGASLRSLSALSQRHVADATAKANEVISNFRTVRAFANESLEEETYGKLAQKSCQVSQYLGFGIGIFQAATNIALNGLVLGVIYAGGYLVTMNDINAGQLMSFLVSSQMIQRSLASLSVLSGSAVRGVSAGARVFEYINAEPRVPITGGKTIPYHCLMGHLRFHDVCFSYPQRPDQEVLRNVDLNVEPCKKVALCGLSGAGKSTIASIAERFYEPTSGSVTLDGIELKELDPSWLRGKVIGFINQEPVLFSGTVEENILYGKPNATAAEVREAAKLANAHDFIAKFPDGYDTIVGERGAALSGGQKQRIAIARALLKNPSILILDEATSALDAESERLVQDALDRVMVNRTVIIIAHRLSTIRNADVIAVMKQGRVVEVGNHQQLKKKKGFYADLIKLQESAL